MTITFLRKKYIKRYNSYFIFGILYLINIGYQNAFESNESFFVYAVVYWKYFT